MQVWPKITVEMKVGIRVDFDYARRLLISLKVCGTWTMQVLPKMTVDMKVGIRVEFDHARRLFISLKISTHC